MISQSGIEVLKDDLKAFITSGKQKQSELGRCDAARMFAIAITQAELALGALNFIGTDEYPLPEGE